MPEVPRQSVPVRTFGVQDAQADPSNVQEQPTSVVRRVLSRMSFASSKRRPSFFGGGDDDGLEQAPIPTMASGEADATPLPKLSMIVLSITMLGEFLSANVSTPFLLFMVKGFGGMADDAEVALWTGILVSTFFLTQFLTSLLWATVAEKHGRRAVLVVSLTGTAFTCLIFGTATSLMQALCIRLLQGVFAGSVGVARGSVAFVTDPSNEGRAYAILGFCWGFGGVAGAIIGGSFERPADKWPEIFKDIWLFNAYPYLLPCAIASAIMLTGGILACFLSPDGGPREGAIQLPPEKDNNHPTIPEEEEAIALDSPFDDEETGGLSNLKKKISRRFSNMFAKRVPDAQTQSPGPSTSATSPLNIPTSNADRTRTFSRTSRANGSAYGYSGVYRNRLASNATLGLRRGSLASTLRQRRGSNYDAIRDSTNTSDMNFAQRLLMANENAVTNIADLWVASAMNVDNDEVFESDDEQDEDDEFDFGLNTAEGQEGGPSSLPSRPSRPHRPSTASLMPPPLRRQSSARRSSLRRPSVSFSPALHPSHRRPSIVPSIFSHSGVRTPPALVEAQRLLAGEEDEHLGTIEESRQTSQADAESLREPPPSLASQLPILIIVQYGVMALHTTTHDQIFMSYLVSAYEVGGLNLNAGHFAQLIALMCIVQIAYQFYLYPNMGPPRGRFSHLAMFRIGTILFIPSYLTVVLYRPLASPEDGGNVLLMIALTISTAIRYAGTVFGYTAISILLNYMTPPAAVGYANGIAQSIVSLARCVGPVIGGYLWSASVQDHPSGYYMGFVVCAAVCAATVAQSFLIR